MNTTLINELKSKCIVCEQRGTTAFNNYMVDKFDTEKFAELIVAECAGLLEKEAESSHDEGTDTYNILLKESNWMKRHFGVEE